MPKMRVTYNAPVILTFTLLAVVVQAVSHWISKDFRANFVAYSDPHTLEHYLGFFTHILGHGSWPHLFGNFAMILLIGPILEERYGSFGLFIMMMITAGITGAVQALFFSNTGLLGASGIVFMLILLASLVNIKHRQIPLTFILVALLYLGQEFVAAFESDNISQLAHIVGGICGAVFGFVSVPKQTSAVVPARVKQSVISSTKTK